MTTKQHTFDEYTDARNYARGSMTMLQDLLWDTHAMNKEINERIQMMIKDEEAVDMAVLNIYGAYANLLKETNDDN